MNIDIQKFEDLFKIKVMILGMKYLGFWEETNGSANGPILNMTRKTKKMNPLELSYRALNN